MKPCIDPVSVAGSFRDPSGRVYRHGDRIFRTVTNEFSSEFDFVESSGFFQKVCKEKLVLSYEHVSPELLVGIGRENKYVLEAPLLPMVSFPYEWSFSALKEAALLHLKIQLMALDFEITMSDASAYNVQFHGSCPIFIDHLSFRRYREGEIWNGHRQFSEQFLNPLLLRAFFGITHNAWYRGTQEGIATADLRRFLRWHHYFNWKVLTHIVLPDIFHQSTLNNSLSIEKNTLSQAGLPKKAFRGMLEKLQSWIKQLTPEDTGKTVWKDYAKEHSYSLKEVDIKKQFIREFVQASCPQILWDIGCNSGDYSVTALESGAKYVVGFDFDQGALDAGFARAQQARLPFQLLFLDAANPSPNQGWRGEERPSLKARANADALIALALIHHLAIARNIPLNEVLDWLMGLAPQGIIEFVPKQDPMVQKLLAFREDIFPFYTEESCLEFIRGRAQILKTIKTSKSDRVLIWYSLNKISPGVKSE